MAPRVSEGTGRRQVGGKRLRYVSASLRSSADACNQSPAAARRARDANTANDRFGADNPARRAARVTFAGGRLR